MVQLSSDCAIHIILYTYKSVIKTERKQKRDAVMTVYDEFLPSSNSLVRNLRLDANVLRAADRDYVRMRLRMLKTAGPSTE